MTHQPKKPADTKTQAKPSSAASKMSESVIRLVEPARKMQEKTLEMGRKNVEQMRGTADGISRVATECRDVCSGNVDTLIEVGATASHNLQNISNEMKDTSNRVIQECTDLMKDAMACRTIDDMVAVQQKAVHQMSNNYFDITNKLYGVFFDSCSEAVGPLSDRSAAASKQIHKAMSA